MSCVVEVTNLFFVIIWEFCTCILIIFTHASQIYPLFFTHSILGLSHPAHIKSSLCYLYILECWAFHWNMANLTRATLLKKTASASFSSFQLLVAGGETSCPTLYSMLWFGLVWACVGFVSAVATAMRSCVQLPCCVQKILFPNPYIHCFWLLCSFQFLFQDDSWGLGGEDVRQMPHLGLSIAQSLISTS